MAFQSALWNGVTYSIPGAIGDTGWSGATKVDGLLMSLAANAVNLTLSQTLSTKSLTSTCQFVDNTDNTKIVALSLSGITTGKTVTLTFSQTANRTLTFPDFTDTFCVINSAQTVKAKTFDTSNLIGDATDTTKQLKWSLSGATTATATTFSFSQTVNRTITFPDASDTVVFLGATQTITGKTFGASTFTGNITLSGASLLCAGNTITGVAALSSNTANQATTGIIRLANTDAINWRNAANSADIGISLNGSNQFAIGAAILMSGSVLVNGNTVTGVASLSSNTANQAAAGIIRLANADQVNWRNAANSADKILTVTASDQLSYAGTAFLSSSGVLLAASFPALTGDVTSVAGALTTTLAATTNGTLVTLSAAAGVAIHGSNTNDSAAAGYIGEIASQTRIESNRTTIASATPTNVTNSALSLTAGDWDIDGTVVFYSNTNTVTDFTAAISKTSATLPAADTSGVPTSGEVKLINDTAANALGAAGRYALRLPTTRASISATTSFYLVAQSTYTLGTSMELYGSIIARRVR